MENLEKKDETIEMFLKRQKEEKEVKSKKVKVENENCIVFEDSVAGIQAANVANMISIGIGNATILNEAKFNFKDFTQIDEAFLNSLINN